MPLLFVSILMSFASICAEYRVYLLDINLPGNNHKMFMSTMDHVQFKQWIRGIEENKIEIMDSWMCPGDTSGFKPMCNKPDAKVNNDKNKHGAKNVVSK